MRNIPQYQQPRTQTVLGRVTWVDESPTEPVWIEFAESEVPAQRPVDMTCVVGDLVSGSWVNDGITLNRVIAHAPTPDTNTSTGTDDDLGTATSDTPVDAPDEGTQA